LGEGGESENGSTIALASLIGGAVIIGLFAARQIHLQRSDAALLDLRTFASRQFALSISIVTIASMALFGAIILLPLYVQEVLGYDALAAGLAILPGALLQGILAPFIGRRYDAVGPRGLVLLGSVLLIVSLGGMAMFAAGTPLWLVTVAHIGVSLGLALLFTPLLTNGLSSLRPELNAHGSAIVGTIQQVAGAAGIALFITLSAAFAGPAAEEGAAITAEGIRAAFLVGTGIALVTLPLVLFVRRVTAPTGGPAVADGAAAEDEQQSVPLAH
jgi:DHA2 family lincomycin resistance protein-like MFS transporter